MDALLALCRESESRSRNRRAERRPRRRRVLVGCSVGFLAVIVGGLAVKAPQVAGGGGPQIAGKGAPQVAGAGAPRATPGPGTAAAASRRPRRDRSGHRKRHKVPSAAAFRDAWSFAQSRSGLVSLAVVDSEGKLLGRDESRRYAAASVVKSMLLAAEVRRLKRADAGIDSNTDALLTAMITYSDNGAADAIYARVGDDGLFEVARRAGMKRFTVAGYWGNAQITAADMARFFGDLDRALTRRHRVYAKGLLGSIIASQRWGIPAAAGEKWATRFKGGWLPTHALVHQAAELRERDGPGELSIAVLSDDQPSHGYGTETVRGVAERLLSASGGG